MNVDQKPHLWILNICIMISIVQSSKRLWINNVVDYFLAPTISSVFCWTKLKSCHDQSQDYLRWLYISSASRQNGTRYCYQNPTKMCDKSKTFTTTVACNITNYALIHQSLDKSVKMRNVNTNNMWGVWKTKKKTNLLQKRKQNQRKQ